MPKKAIHSGSPVVDTLGKHSGGFGAIRGEYVGDTFNKVALINSSFCREQHPRCRWRLLYCLVPQVQYLRYR